MIPGPVELSPAVVEALSGPTPGHLAPRFIESFGRVLEMMREVWQAGADSHPFVIGGGGTAAMNVATANLLEPGETAVVVNTGYFSDRLAEMLRRQGADVAEVVSPNGPGDAPLARDVERALDENGPVKALLATHVDTSTGVRIDPCPLARLARERGILSVFDGVCATGGESFRMEEWGADVYLTASQKALGAPPGLALLVASPAAMEARARRRSAQPPMYLDLEQWMTVMDAYEARRPAYFSTPATGLILALEAALAEIVADGVERRVARHQRVASALSSAWAELGLRPVPVAPELQSATLSALYPPEEVDAADVVRGAAAHGVAVAGGLHPQIRNRSFRVGHMGYAVTRREMLLRTVEAVGAALRDAGASGADSARALAAAEGAL
jgi:alanine-glyoxylate transaminase/serine-glyoxylate transaminase/serine-pyruvate transaminase